MIWSHVGGQRVVLYRAIVAAIHKAAMPYCRELLVRDGRHPKLDRNSPAITLLVSKAAIPTPTSVLVDWTAPGGAQLTPPADRPRQYAKLGRGGWASKRHPDVSVLDVIDVLLGYPCVFALARRNSLLSISGTSVWRCWRFKSEPPRCRRLCLEVIPRGVADDRIAINHDVCLFEGLL